MKYFAIGLRLVIGLCLIVGIVVYIYDSKVVQEQFSSLNLLWLVVAAICITLSTFIGALNVYLLGHQRNVLSFRRFIPLYWMAWAIGLIFPGQIGDMAALSAMLKKKGMDLHASIGRLLIDKMISLLVISTLALWGITTVIALDLTFLARGYFFVAASVIAGIIFLAKEKIKYYLRVFLPRGMQFLSNLGLEFNLIFKGSLIRVFLNFSITIVKIAISGFSYWCVFSAFGYKPNDFLQLVGLVAASSVVAYIPISVNGIGTAEITGVVLFSKLGIPDAVILSVYLTLRVIVMILAWLPTGMLLLFTRKET